MKCTVKAVVGVLLVLCVICGCGGMVERMGQAAVPLVEDGAWCWFQDERAIIYDGGRKMTVGSITRAGDAQVTTADFSTGELKTNILHKRLEKDDHDAPAILVRRDGRLMAFYTRHGRSAVMYYRVSANPGDGTLWEPEQSYSAGLDCGFTYANPFQLSGEAGRIYVFWRGLHWNPTYSTSDDNGNTWSKGKNFIFFQKGDRPYVKYASNNVDMIHFAFTQGHPNRPFANNLYHAYYRGGKLYTSEGAFVCSFTERPINISEATVIYDGDKAGTGEAWVWDVALDLYDRPVVAYSTHVNAGDHRYRYARWDSAASRWMDHQIAYAGTCLYAEESYYSGGIAIDPDKTDVVYISSDVNIVDGSANASGHYEIYRGVTEDDGVTWAWRPITANSTADNIRPIVPSGHPGRTFVLWMKGIYRNYGDYDTDIVLTTDAALLRFCGGTFGTGAVER